MSSTKCKGCGFVQLPATYCRQCGLSLQEQIQQQMYAPPSVVADGYVFPPPPTAGRYPSTVGVWRESNKLVMGKDATLPDRCVKCDAPANGIRLRRRLSWHHPALYLLIFVTLLLYIIVALIVRQTANIEIGLCEEHLAKRRRNIAITWFLIVIGLLGVIFAMVMEDPTPAVIGGLLFLAGAIYGIATIRLVVPAKIDKRFVWLRGISNDYLNSLPAWPGY